MAMLIAKNLHKTYHDNDEELHILNGVDLELAEGEFVCISGKSGCGKSTLLHLLGLLDVPDAGSITIDGRLIEMNQTDISRFRNSHIGFVFQFHYLMEDLNALENVALPMMVAGKSYKDSLQKSQEILSMLELDKRLKHFPHQLSGGEQQRVALARALINAPKLILADEPTGNLDPHHSKEVIDLMLQINRNLGCSFLIVTHDANSAEAGHSHYLLEDGVLLRQP